MNGHRRFLVVAGVLLASATLLSTPAAAQVDLSGAWAGVFHEDLPHRNPGAMLGDYAGLPINDNARAFAEAWNASRNTVPEHQCQAHTAPYIERGPLNMRIWEERDPQTQQIVAIHLDISNYQQRRTIWMDGRAHPSPNAEYTWMGFSTGEWEGDTLVVTTSHIKQEWMDNRQRRAPKRSGRQLKHYSGMATCSHRSPIRTIRSISASRWSRRRTCSTVRVRRHRSSCHPGEGRRDCGPEAGRCAALPARRKSVSRRVQEIRTAA